MIRALIPYLFTAIIAVILRDVEVFVAAKIFCWRKRRETQRQAQQDRELRELQAKLISAEELEKSARIAKVMMAASKVPYPQLLGGPLVVKARCDHDFMLITKQLHGNFKAQGKPIVEANFEEN
jgi:hypothetical protein